MVSGWWLEITKDDRGFMSMVILEAKQIGSIKIMDSIGCSSPSKVTETAA